MVLRPGGGESARFLITSTMRSEAESRTSKSPSGLFDSNHGIRRGRAIRGHFSLRSAYPVYFFGR